MVSNGMNKARQQKIVGEGLAVGVLSLGVEAVTSNKQAVEFAFRRAWRGWSCNSLFPQIHASVVRNDIVGIMHRSSNRSGMITADWTSGREHVPTLREAWPIEEAGEAVGEEAGVSHAQWKTRRTTRVRNQRLTVTRDTFVRHSEHEHRGVCAGVHRRTEHRRAARRVVRCRVRADVHRHRVGQAGPPSAARRDARLRAPRCGRRPVLSAAKAEHARKLRDGGEHTMTQIAELVGCSRATLYWVLDVEAAQVSA